MSNESQLEALRSRLAREEEWTLLKKIVSCGEEIGLICESCGRKHLLHKKCKKKWCPRCAPSLAAKRATEMRGVAEQFVWPLFITLTMRNVDDLNATAVRTLRRAFGRLRHQRFWRENVTGGFASVEITNIGNGWHPHLHAVLDCRWLSLKTPRPQRGEKAQSTLKKCKAASQELEKAWARLLKQPTASVKVKRCNAGTISKEVCKYTVKGSDLIESKGRIGDLIRALESCRLMTTFGSAHGRVSQLRAIGKEQAALREDLECQATGKNRWPGCCPDPTLNLEKFSRVAAPLEEPRMVVMSK